MTKSKEKIDTADDFKKYKIIFGIILAAEAITSFLILNALAKLNLLQTWQYLLVVLLFGGIFLLNLYKLIISKRASRASKIICIVGAIFFTIAGAFGYKYARQTIDFVENVTGSRYETQIYQVRVLKSSSYKEVEQLADVVGGGAVEDGEEHVLAQRHHDAPDGTEGERRQQLRQVGHVQLDEGGDQRGDGELFFF